MVDPQTKVKNKRLRKKARCPNFFCLGVADPVGVHEYWCKLCGSRWLIKEMMISTKSKRQSGFSGSGETVYHPDHLYEEQNPRLRRNRY